ncbi:Uncharacterized protein Fot_27102 [Forsythia ovata]|uniref:Uncharacterized protein n=1 Tax=Forsythia ovata TaxID=205694 RepID=A0ABD1UDS4_9LAMI
MAARISLSPFATVCIILSVLTLMMSISEGASHSPSHAPSHAPTPAPSPQSGNRVRSAAAEFSPDFFISILILQYAKLLTKKFIQYYSSQTPPENYSQARYLFSTKNKDQKGTITFKRWT